METALLSAFMGNGGGINPLGYLASGAQAGMGIYQLLTAPKRPQLQIPSSALENKDIAQNAYSEGMPTQSYQNQQSSIDRNQTAALYTAGKSRNSSAAIAGITQASNNAYGDLNAKDALMRAQNRERLMQINNQLANYDWAMQQDKIAQAVQERAAGWQNLWGGMSGIANMAMFDKKSPSKSSFGGTSSSATAIPDYSSSLQQEYSMMPNNYTPNANYDAFYNPFYSYQVK